MVLKPAGQGPAEKDDTFNRMGDNAKLMDTRLRSYWPIRDEYDATNLPFICRKWLSPRLPQRNAMQRTHDTNSTGISFRDVPDKVSSLMAISDAAKF